MLSRCLSGGAVIRAEVGLNQFYKPIEILDRNLVPHKIHVRFHTSDKKKKKRKINPRHSKCERCVWGDLTASF